MLKIRLSRVGKRNNPSFRIVVTEHYKPVKSGFIEHIGFYNPQNKKFQINKEKLESWTKKGATYSVAINNLLVREKILPKDKTIKITRVPKKKEEEEEKEETKAEEKKEAPQKAKKEEKKEAKSEKKAEKEEPKAETKKEEKKPKVDKK